MVVLSYFVDEIILWNVYLWYIIYNFFLHIHSGTFKLTCTTTHSKNNNNNNYVKMEGNVFCLASMGKCAWNALRMFIAHAHFCYDTSLKHGKEKKIAMHDEWFNLGKISNVTKLI